MFVLKNGILGTNGGTVGGHALNICRVLSENPEVEICGLFGDDKAETKDMVINTKNTMPFVEKR